MKESLLVIGGGIAGLRACLDAAKAGAHVILVEKAPTVGGKMAAVLDEESPSVDLAPGVEIPRMDAIGQREDIELFPLAEVVKLEGEPASGGFNATIRQRARFVTDACTQCNKCRQVCPVVVPNEFDSGMAFRKAIYSPLRNSVPKTYVIDIHSCLNDPPNYLPCQRCVEVCEPHCIDFLMPAEQVFEREAAAVIVAVGYDLPEPGSLRAYGYGTHPDILNSMELERLLASTGPTGGFLEKPSNEEDPQNVLYVLCDTSALTWNYTARHTVRLAYQDVGDITVLYPEPGAVMGKLDPFWHQKGAKGVKLVRGVIESVQPNESNTLHVRYKSAHQGEKVSQDFDLVVLATGIRPNVGLSEMARALEIELSQDGYIKVLETQPNHVATSRPGVYAAGCASGPKDIPASLEEASTAATHALAHIERPVQLAQEKKAEVGAGLIVEGKPIPQEELARRLEQVLWSLVALGEQKRP